MKNIIARSIAGLALAAGSLGLTATVASASTHAPTKSYALSPSLKGKVANLSTTKKTFSLVVGVKTYTVTYKTTTSFRFGTISKLKNKATVTVTGTVVGLKVTATRIQFSISGGI